MFLLSEAIPILRIDSLKHDPRGSETGIGGIFNSFHHPGSFWCQKLKGKPGRASLKLSYRPNQACATSVIFVLTALALRWMDANLLEQLDD